MAQGVSAGKFATECAGRADETRTEQDEGAGLGGGAAVTLVKTKLSSL